DALTAACALACKQRREDPLSREERCGQIRDRQSEAVRRSISRSGDAHEAAFGLQHGVVASFLPARPLIAKPGDRAVQEARMLRSHALVIEAEPLNGARREVFDEDVGAIEECVDDRSRRWMLQIERQAFLVAVDAEE